MSGKYLLVVAVLCSILTLTSPQGAQPPSSIVDPAFFYNMVELVCSEGYSIQEHTVITEDGYILTIHRIPNSKKRTKVPRKRNHYQQLHKGYHPDFENCVNESRYERPTGPPVLIAHGLFVASDSWILQGPKYDLAYILLEEGYDIWFTNIRGNYYSRNHVTMSPSDPAFFDFSYHEFGFYDIPATIDCILNITGYPKLFYVGHSMGTTMFFVMASMKPEYNDKIELFVGMASVGQLKREHFSPERAAPLRTLILFINALEDQGVGELLPRNVIQAFLAKTICSRGSVFQNFCYDILFSIVGYHSKLYLKKIFPMIVSHSFSGTSVKTLRHYLQSLNAPSFQNYDYGPEENFRRYGQAETPSYNLSNVKAPVVLFYSENDYIIDPKDAELLIPALPNVLEVIKVSKYSHTDFVWAYTARNLVYNKTVELINRFRNQ